MKITKETFNQTITIPMIEYIILKRHSKAWMEVVDIEARGIFSTEDVELIDKYYKDKK